MKQTKLKQIIMLSLTSLLYSSTSVAHILFINMNSQYNNDAEYIKVGNIVKENCKIKKIKPENCEKVIKIPENKNDKIDSELISKQFSEALKKVPQGQTINSVVISAHSDGENFSKYDANNPNRLTIDSLTALFRSIKADSRLKDNKLESSGTLISEVDLKTEQRAKFKPESLYLLSCYGTQKDQNISKWFDSLDSLKLILGSTMIWPIANSDKSNKLLELGLKLPSLIEKNPEDFVSIIEKSYRETIALNTDDTHDVSMAVRSKSISGNPNAITYREIISRNTTITRAELISDVITGSTFRDVPDEYTQGGNGFSPAALKEIRAATAVSPAQKLKPTAAAN